MGEGQGRQRGVASGVTAKAIGGDLVRGRSNGEAVGMDAEAMGIGGGLGVG